jgi:hypothetical protein
MTPRTLKVFVLGGALRQFRLAGRQLLIVLFGDYWAVVVERREYMSK